MTADAALPVLRSLVQPRSRGMPVAVLAALLYYWMHQYLRVLLPPASESTTAYLITTVPIVMLAALGLAPIALSGRAWRGMPGIVPLLIFVALAGVISLARDDLPTLLTVGLFVLALMWLAAEPVRLSLFLINLLFAASIAAGGLFYLAGYSDFGLLPGQYAEGADRGLEWRVSLFPFVPESAFFALIVLIANQVQARGGKRILWCGIALYFVLLSGLRSAVGALLLCEAYLWVSAGGRRLTALGRAALIVMLLALFVASVAASSVLLLIPEFAPGPLANYLLRSAADDVSAESLSQSVYRGWLWLQHLELFAGSPWIGVGTFEFASLVDDVIEGHVGTGSESFVTSWLARLGTAAIPFFYYVGSLFARATRQSEPLDACVCLVLGVAAFTYGSFLVPYNFVFLLMFGMLLSSPQKRS